MRGGLGCCQTLRPMAMPAPPAAMESATMARMEASSEAEPPRTMTGTKEASTMRRKASILPGHAVLTTSAPSSAAARTAKLMFSGV